MPLKLVTGPANAAKAGEVLGPLRERLAEDPVLVVPTFEDVEHAQRELAQRGAVFGAQVVRGKRLFELIARATGYSAKRASDLQRSLLVERAVGAAGLSVLERSSQRPGFVPAADRLFAELGSELVDPARFTQALRAWAGDGPRRPYADELAALYSRYHSELERAGLVDAPLYARRALDALRRDPGAWKAPVYFYGFDDLTGIEHDAVETLARCCDVTLSLPWEPGREALRATETLRAELREVATEVIELDAIDTHYDAASRPVLHALERHLFEAPPDPVPDPGDAVALHVCGGQRAEIELCAAEVLKLIRAGTPPGEIAVVFREPAGYAPLVAQVFGAYGIPYSLDRPANLSRTSLGAGLLALLRCAEGSGSADDLLTWLRTPGRLREPGLADRLEYLVRRTGARTAAEARAIWDDRIAAFPLDRIDRLARARGTSERLAALRAEAALLFAAPWQGTAPILDPAEAAEARAFEAADAALAELAELADRGNPIAPERIGELLADLPVKAGASAIADRVLVASPLEVRARRFDAMFVCGMQEDEFPRRARTEAFLPDADRRAIASASGLALPLRADRARRERYLFYACVSRAERRLVISTRTSGEEGELQARSPFAEAVIAVVPAIDEDGRRIMRTLGDVTWPVADAPTELEWERAVAARGERRLPREIGPLQSEAAIAVVRDRGPVSAGALERYASCPVAWLVEKVLRPAALAPDPEAMVRGTFAHAVLRDVFEGLLAEGHARVTEANLARAEELLTAALTSEREDLWLGSDPARVAAALHRLEFELRTQLAREASSESLYEPAEFELAFGLAGDPHPSVEVAGVAVAGRIDRVDVHGDRAVVKDYKSGRADDFRVDLWQEKNRFQAALYMAVVRELLGKEPVAGLFVSLRDGKDRGVVLDDAKDELGGAFVRTDVKSADEIAAVEEWARAALADAAAGMQAGTLRSCPGECAYRGGCAFPSICRVEQ